MVLHPISSGVLYGYPLVIAFQIYTFFIIPSNVTSYVILSSTPALFLSKQYAGYSLPLSLYTTIYVFTTTSPFFNNLPQSPLESSSQDKLTLITCLEDEPEYRRYIQAVKL